MARAPKLQDYDAREARMSRDYLKGALAGHVGGKLDDDANGIWLVNPASKATYNLCLVQPPDHQLGMVRLSLDRRTGDPIHGKAGSAWLALHEPVSNRVWLMPWQELLRWSREIARSPNSYPAGSIRVHGDGDGVHLSLNPDWAASVKLVRKVVTLKQGEFSRFRDRRLATKEDFCHLHVHSTFSLLDGASTIEGIAETAMLNGQPGIALTDHGYMFGAFKHWAACRERGLKPLVGVEAYIVDNVNQHYVAGDGRDRRFEYHQTIIAMNQEGWENLCRLMTAACRDHFHYVPRIDHRMLFEHNAGLIVLSGCFKGMVAHYLQTRPLKEGESELPWWLKRDKDRAVGFVREYKRVFADRYYAEVQNIDYGPYSAVVPEILEIAASEGVPPVATNDCHYEREEDAILQAVLTRISTQKVDGLGDAMRERGCYFIRTRAEIEGGATWVSKEMLDRTCEIMGRCNLSFEKKGYLFPPYDLRADADWQAFQASRQPVVVPMSAPDPNLLARSDGPVNEPRSRRSRRLQRRRTGAVGRGLRGSATRTDRARVVGGLLSRR